jgi:hypothetical protein
MSLTCKGSIKKIGVEKNKTFLKNFDSIYDMYKKKAVEMGYDKDLIIIREHGKVLIYICLDNSE